MAHTFSTNTHKSTKPVPFHYMELQRCVPWEGGLAFAWQMIVARSLHDKKAKKGQIQNHELK